jgi:hypothetical protein
MNTDAEMDWKEHWRERTGLPYPETLDQWTEQMALAGYTPADIKRIQWEGPDEFDRKTFTIVMLARLQERHERLTPTSGQLASPANGVGSIDSRMCDTLLTNPDAIGWTKAKWADHLNCSPSGIQRTTAWQNIMGQRSLARFERMNKHRSLERDSSGGRARDGYGAGREFSFDVHRKRSL